MTCKTCRFGVVASGKIACHRMPPHVEVLDTSGVDDKEIGNCTVKSIVVWPYMLADEWCGEFQPQVSVEWDTAVARMVVTEVDA